jgi:hypothetical protein
VVGLYAVAGISENTYVAATLLGLIPVAGLVWLLAIRLRR